MHHIDKQAPLVIRAVNTLGGYLKHLGLSGPTIAAAELVELAQKRTGLVDYGSTDFFAGLEVLVESVNCEAKLSLIGRFATKVNLLRELEKRLRIIRYRKENPVVCEQRIIAPVIITGLPRTGTTLLYELLALDPRLRAPRAWEISKPADVNPLRPLSDNRKIAQVKWEYKQLNYLAPRFQTIHPMEAQSPQECALMLATSFNSEMWRLQYYCPTYRQWQLKQKTAEAYRWHNYFLQHLQAKVETPRWLLKNPMHLGEMDTLIAQYPDVSIIQTHRDPVEVAASATSMACITHAIHSNHVNPVAVGKEELDYLAEVARRGVIVRERRSQETSRFHDVHYGDLLAKPIEVIAGIYHHFHWPFSEHLQRDMRQYLATHSQHQRGVHRYRQEDFGFDSRAVTNAFAVYYQWLRPSR